MTLRVGTKRYMVVEFMKTLDKDHDFNDAVNKIHKIVGTTLNEARTYYRTLGQAPFLPNFHSNYVAGKRGRQVGTKLTPKIKITKPLEQSKEIDENINDLEKIRKNNLKRIKEVHKTMNYGAVSTLTNYRYDDNIDLNNEALDFIKQDGMVSTILFDD